MTHFYSYGFSEANASLGTSDVYLARPPRATALRVAGTGDFEWNFARGIVDVVRYDDSASTYSRSEKDNVRDDSTSTVLTLDSFEGGADYLFIGARTPFKSLYIDVSAANGTSSVATWSYWNGSTWADTGDTDGTISSAKTLAVDGAVTWTIPAAWEAIEPGDNANLTNGLFYVRLGVNTTLDSEVEVAQITLGSEDTNYFDEDELGDIGVDTGILPVDVVNVGGVIIKAAAGTPTVTTYWYGR